MSATSGVVYLLHPRPAQTTSHLHHGRRRLSGAGPALMPCDSRQQVREYMHRQRMSWFHKRSVQERSRSCLRLVGMLGGGVRYAALQGRSTALCHRMTATAGRQEAGGEGDGLVHRHGGHARQCQFTHGGRDRAPRVGGIKVATICCPLLCHCALSSCSTQSSPQPTLARRPDARTHAIGKPATSGPYYSHQQGQPGSSDSYR